MFLVRQDAWSVAAALASACFILRLEEAGADGSNSSPEELNAATLFSSAILCNIWAAAETGGLLAPDRVDAQLAASEVISELSAQALPLLYLGIVTTFVAQWLQAIGQSRVRANDAAVIYALDPVYAAGFSYLLLGETLGPQGLVGAGVVLAAVLLSRSSSGVDTPAQQPQQVAEEVNDAKSAQNQK